MGTTPNLKLPFPEQTDVLDGPDALSDLATATESYFYDRTLPTGITRAPAYHWGTGVAYPASNAVRIGDTFVHSGLLSLMRWNGGAWRQAERAEVASGSVRAAISTNFSALLYPGFTVYEADAQRVFTWDTAYGWLKIDGPHEVIYDNYNMGGSGQVAAGSGQFVSSLNITLPSFASRRGVVHYTASVASVSSTSGVIGDLGVYLYGNLVALQIFNVSQYGGNLTFTIPVTLSKGDTSFAVRLGVSSGPNAFIAYSALRVTF